MHNLNIFMVSVVLNSLSIALLDGSGQRRIFVWIKRMGVQRTNHPVEIRDRGVVGEIEKEEVDRDESKANNEWFQIRSKST